MKALSCAAALLTAMAAPAGAVDMRPYLDLETAATIRDACLAYAADHDMEIAVSVFDQTGQLLTFAKMNGASTAAAELSRWKGTSAAKYLIPSSETGKWNAPTAPSIATFAGGVPIFTKDDIGVGGVGVSGAASEDDVKCGTAGVKAAGLSTSKSK